MVGRFLGTFNGRHEAVLKSLGSLHFKDPLTTYVTVSVVLILDHSMKTGMAGVAVVEGTSLNK